MIKQAGYIFIALHALETHCVHAPLDTHTPYTLHKHTDGIQRNEWADIYREDDDPVPYPPCVITVHALNSTHHADGQHDGQDDGGQHDGGLRDGGASTSRWSVFASIDCGAHCVLTASSTDGWQHAALLGRQSTHFMVNMGQRLMHLPCNGVLEVYMSFAPQTHKNKHTVVCCTHEAWSTHRFDR